MKLRFLYLTQVAFWAGQEAEIEFTVPGDNFKDRFLDLIQVAFWAGLGGRKLVQSAMGALEILLYRNHPSSIFG